MMYNVRIKYVKIKNSQIRGHGVKISKKQTIVKVIGLKMNCQENNMD